MSAEVKSDQQKRIESGLAGLLVGEDKYLTIVAALSIATLAAHQLNLPKMELQKMLMRMYDKRERGQ